MYPADTSSKTPIVRIDELIHRVESLADPEARASAVELATAVMAFHAAALRRLLEMVSDASGGTTVDLLAADQTVSSILVLHGLHPDDLKTRVRRALDKLTTFFDSRGARITLVEFNAESVRVRLTSHRPGSGKAAKLVIENVIYEAAPELEELIIEGIEERHDPTFVPLADLATAQEL